ncbi:MAG: segregation/condensation protein A [Rhodospirillaceae bacterium]|nr:segregation/condensation protein A [Rhodospirillaceae bacterium]|tara:strand:+ start:504 stop:1298 length:795 start_codon:yes stop_codon:yes gene_type:complete
MSGDASLFEEDERNYFSDQEPIQLSLFLTLDGFEGPIDVLLSLAREQKVDLTQISILELAEQYLAFVQQAQSLNLEVAADYLVMAAWLAFLKSRLLLPKDEENEETSPEELAEALRFQLQRLEAMREVGAKLMGGPQLGLDRFARGMPEKISNILSPVYDISLFELLKIYGNIRLRNETSSLRIISTRLFAVDEAIERLKTMLAGVPDWQTLVGFLPKGLHNELLARSAVASTFAASLELVKEGSIELRQDEKYGPIYLRQRDV